MRRFTELKKGVLERKNYNQVKTFLPKIPLLIFMIDVVYGFYEAFFAPSSG